MPVAGVDKDTSLPAWLAFCDGIVENLLPDLEEHTADRDDIVIDLYSDRAVIVWDDEAKMFARSRILYYLRDEAEWFTIGAAQEAVLSYYLFRLDGGFMEWAVGETHLSPTNRDYRNLRQAHFLAIAVQTILERADKAVERRLRRAASLEVEALEDE